MLDTMIKMDTGLDAGQIVKQIDTIIPELLALRRRLAITTTMLPAESGGLTAALYGVLGHGTWDEYAPDLDWARFGA
jgi:hypothetical protein